MPTYIPLGAARTVTGSRHLFEHEGVRVLVDCGLYQERELVERNWAPLPVPAEQIHAVVMTHAHIDHSGWLPVLVRDGFRGPVFATGPTCEIIPILLADAARLQAEDARTKAKRHAAEGRSSPHGEPRPLYDEAEVEAAVRRLRPVAFGARTEVAPGVAATWLPAGHILGAAIILLEIGGRRVVLSGDLGRHDRPLLPDPSPPPASDLIIVESTYGDRLHGADADIPGQLAEVVAGAAARGGKVLMPTFAVERAQEVLWHLEALRHAGRIPALPVFLDSPMAVRLVEVFGRHDRLLDGEHRALAEAGRSPFRFPGLRLCAGREDSKAINAVKGPAVIIAGSGMCNGGRIKHHLGQWIDDPASVLLFTGYQATGTLGRLLVEGARRVRLFGREREVRLAVAQLQGMSAHADRDEALGWLRAQAGRASRCCVIHGGERVAPAFAELVQRTLGLPAHAPTYLERVDF